MTFHILCNGSESWWYSHQGLGYSHVYRIQVGSTSGWLNSFLFGIGNPVRRLGLGSFLVIYHLVY